MGTYLNPGNEGFKQILKGKYVDKTGMIALINENIDTPDKLVCVSRPRRFGKSFAAKMLCAYYDKSCDSRELFDGLSISMAPSYTVYLNKMDVIYIDMTNILGNVDAGDVVSFIKSQLMREIRHAYPGAPDGETLDQILINTVGYTGNKYVMIIDEWDAPIRETPQIQAEYLEFLRMLFKSSGTTDRIFAAAYLTGILPIKKDGSESAISDFWEYSMLEPGRFQDYIGFTELDVNSLCEEYSMSIEEAHKWYDGYTFDVVGSIYNPYSVMRAMKMHKFKSYWRMSSSADTLEEYIRSDYDGLFDTVMQLLSGIRVSVDTDGFNNDISTIRSRDDLLTLLVHLGYLTYRDQDHTAAIPNEEIRLEFEKSIREVKSTEAIQRLSQSRQLIADTIAMNEEAVAESIESVHALISDPLHYNNEQALRCTIHIAYYAYPEQYIKFEELPSGDGYADVVFMPKRASAVPALVVELKWNASAEGAIAQIKKNRYYESLSDYGGDILLVGISYDKNRSSTRRHHTCIIEKI